MPMAVGYVRDQLSVTLAKFCISDKRDAFHTQVQDGAQNPVNRRVRVMAVDERHARCRLKSTPCIDRISRALT